ncbi:Outer membrane efflux protein [Neorhodopirellula pilleata]|uniref:Outer membrane efflux protein n=2 Tax=Neorhodopirellula pilleata TaxID=2714738 RepID=A0A5C6AP53_9BACT|nr:Outer membrane efflux protein [Neorhodopirellula pilleata]
MDSMASPQLLRHWTRVCMLAVWVCVSTAGCRSTQPMKAVAVQQTPIAVSAAVAAAAGKTGPTATGGAAVGAVDAADSATESRRHDDEMFLADSPFRLTSAELPVETAQTLPAAAAEAAEAKVDAVSIEELKPPGGNIDPKLPNRDDAEADSADENLPMPRLLPPPLRAGDADAGLGLPLDQVVASVQSFFPLLEVAYLERDRTAGDQIAAWGEFDTKLKARTENQSLGFYENYQHGGGVYQPLYNGADVYASYRIGRGVFEPWYLERQTNEGGELKTGFNVPLLRDHDIDRRRAELWRATYDRQLAEPAIRQEVIGTIRDATLFYWEWVAAGQQYQIGKAALELAQRRNQQIQRRVEEGDLGEPDLADNRRAIIQRQGKLIDLERKLIQSAVKLSLFLRDENAMPLTPTENELAEFPPILPYDISQLEDDINYAVRNRPELVSMDLMIRRVRVDLAEAFNETKPVLDAFSNVSQDLGEPTSNKRDKSELELEIGMEFELPVQRRKGFGKMRSARAKIGQIEAKRQFTVEKISTEVQNAAAALDAAYARVEAITDAVEISEELAQIERRKFELGESDLLAVFLREQIAIEAASELMVAKLDYFIARADYTAALAYEFPVLFTPPSPPTVPAP